MVKIHLPIEKDDIIQIKYLLGKDNRTVRPETENLIHGIAENNLFAICRHDKLVENLLEEDARKRAVKEVRRLRQLFYEAGFELTLKESLRIVQGHKLIFPAIAIKLVGDENYLFVRFPETTKRGGNK